MKIKSYIPAARALIRPSFLAATLFVGVSSAALALDTAYGQNTRSFKEQAAVAQQQRLEQAGYSDISDLQLRKRGFMAHAVKDGRPVRSRSTNVTALCSKSCRSGPGAGRLHCRPAHF